MTDHNQSDHQSSRVSDEPRYKTHFEPESAQVCHELIAATATVNDTDPVELEKLANIIDTDALNALFQPHVDGRHSNGDIHLRFRYAGHLVDIRSNGTIAFYRDSDGD